MNDELREKLSAYLDGALPDAERRAVELELSRSTEMQRELEALRSVSGAVKGLPREPLPGGFMARLQARRARETEPVRDWVLLPPAYRPVAAAMSMAIVAFVVWDKAHGPSELAPKIAWDGTNDRVAVKSASEVPTSMDLSGRVAASDPAEPLELKTAAAKKEEAVDKLAVTPPGRRAAAPGKPIGILEEAPTFAGAKAGGGGNSAPAAAPAPAPSAEQAAAVSGAEGKVTSSFLARSEEERSAINERLYKNFEDEKKRMGIARIIEKGSDDRPARADSGDDDVMTLQATPGAVGIGGKDVGAARGASQNSLKAKARAKKRTPAVMVKAIALKTPEALQAAWVGAGLPDQPPSVDFPKEMAVFLVCPGNCAIVSVENRKRFLVVLYNDSEDYTARVRAVPMTSKPVVVKPAE